MNEKEIEDKLANKEDIIEFLKEISKIINPKIKTLLDSQIDKKFHQLVEYQINVGGKRVRPALVILSCLICGGKIKDCLYPAAAIEIFHNESLIIDDIIDESFWRRNQLTCWKKFGESMALCVNMIYAGSYFEGLKKSKKIKELLLEFIKIMKKVSEGEILDVLFEQAGREKEPYVLQNRITKIALQDYIDMITKKTASLISGSCVIGGICAGAKPKYIKALKNFGLNIGIVFQIKDDILDFYGRKKELGKKEGQDIREHKLGNILTLYALKQLPSKKKNKLLKILRKKKVYEKDVKEALNIIKTTNAKQKAERLAEKFLKEAKKNLYILPENKWREKLEKLSIFVLTRQK